MAIERIIDCRRPVHFPRESHKPFRTQRWNRSIGIFGRPPNQSIDRSAKKAIINQGKLEIYCDSQQIRETAAVDVVAAAASRVRKSNEPLNELEKLRNNVKDKTQSRI